MKKFLIGLILLNYTVVNATVQLRAQDSITVDNGKVSETGILTDSKGIIFFEFLKGSFINYTKDGQPFIGEILAPSIIDRTEKLPRGRMRDILTFELLSDNADELNLVDRYTLMHPKEYLRETLANPDGLVHNSGIKFLTRIYDKDKIGNPVLWRLETKKTKNSNRELKYWKRIGGTLIETPENNIKIFKSIIFKTGIYGLFDENPKPFYSQNTPLQTVEKVEQSPFPSVVPQPQLNEVSNPENSDILDSYENNNLNNQDNETLIIPAIKEENTKPIIIPAIKSNNHPIKIEKEKKNPKNEMFASTIDLENIKSLPVAGKEKISSRFPIILILSFFVISFSIYLAFKKDYKI